MTDLRHVADVLAKAAGLALELWLTADGRKPGAQEPWRSSSPELEALHEKVLKLASTHTVVANAILEESLSLSVARDLRSMMEARNFTRESLQATIQLDAPALDDILDGVSGGRAPLMTLALLARALDARVQILFVPTTPTVQTETDLSTLVHDAEVLLGAPPPAGAR